MVIFVYIHLTLIFFIFVNLVRYLKCLLCPFWWRNWVLLASCTSSYMTNSLVLWKFMLDKKGYPFKGSLFSIIFGLVFISTTELFTRKLLLSIVYFYLQLSAIFLAIDYSVLARPLAWYPLAVTLLFSTKEENYIPLWAYLLV